MNTVLVTGANRGIGLEFVKQYAKANDKILACCRAPEKAVALQELSKAHPSITILPLDVTDPQSIKALAEQLKNETIDILINNAGIYGESKQQLGHVPTESFEKVFLTNAVGPFKMVEAFVEQVSKSKLKIIVSISSILGSIQESDSTNTYAYSASKAALNKIMRCLSVDLRNKGIGVLTMHPGWVKTDMGGPNAQVDVTTSVAGLRKVILQNAHKNSGAFYSYTGEEIPW